MVEQRWLLNKRITEACVSDHQLVMQLSVQYFTINHDSNKFSSINFTSCGKNDFEIRNRVYILEMQKNVCFFSRIKYDEKSLCFTFFEHLLLLCFCWPYRPLKVHYFGGKFFVSKSFIWSPSNDSKRNFWNESLRGGRLLFRDLALGS